MAPSNKDKSSLNGIFVVWLVAANLIALIAPDWGLGYWLGETVLWTTLMPVLCLALLNTRRALGLVLALFCLPVVALARAFPTLS